MRDKECTKTNTMECIKYIKIMLYKSLYYYNNYYNIYNSICDNY